MAIRFYKDIETQEDIQFKNASGTNAGKIEQSGDDLVISNAVGDVLFGDTNSDVYIGDGVNNVDLLFEQSGSIKGEDGGSVTLTIGSSDTTLSLYAPKITNLSTQSSEATALMINGSNVVGTRELGSAAFSATSAFASASHTHSANDITSGTLNSARIPSPSSGDWWNNGYVKVLTDGVMEVGKYMDWHSSDTATSDYDYRMYVSSGRMYMSGDLEIDGGDLYLNDGNTRLHEGNGNGLRMTTNSGYLELGPMNTGHAHIQTDRTNFYFNKELRVDTGVIGSYNEDLFLRRATDSNNQIQITTSGAVFSKALYVPQYIYHNGDTNTYLTFDTDRIRLVAGGTTKFDSNNTYLTSINNGNWSGTDLAIANGGTGASTASAARTNLGLGSIATANTSDYDKYVEWKLVADDDTSSAIRSDNYVKFTGSTVSGSGTSGDPYEVSLPTSSNYYLNGITKSGNTLTFSVSGATNQTYTFGSNAFTSTTIPTNNNQLTNGAGYLTSINNSNWSGTDLSVANGGTGSSTASGARTNLGLGTAATSASTDFVAVTGDTMSGSLNIGDGSANTLLIIKKSDTNVADHIQFYNGNTRVGEIGALDNDWLRINQTTNKNIYTPRYIRADNGFFVDGTSKGINGSGNFIGGTITGASDANVSNWDTAYGWGDHSSEGYLTAHPNISAASSVNNSNRTYIQDITLDSNGHITAITSATETVTNTNTQLSNEQVQDIVGAMVSSNTETNISVTYDDTNGKLNFVSTDTNTVTRVGVSGSEVDGTVTIAAGGDASISQSGNTITITANDTNTTYSVGDGGLTQKNFTSALKTKLDGIATSANNYSLPLGTASVRGGFKIGYTENGKNYPVELSSEKMYVNVPWTDTNTTYSVGDGGLTQKNFTSTLKTKLDGIATSADNYADWKFVDNADASTNIRSANYVKFDGATINGSGTSGDPYIVNTQDTNTTYTADGNYGMTLNGTAFRLEDDRRRNSTSADIYTGNTHDYTFYDASVGIRWYTAGAEEMRLENDGDLHVDGDVIAYSTTVSDRRLKDDIETIQDATDKVKQLRGVEYTWNDGSREGQREIGVIAQEVEKVVPEIVHEKSLPFLGNDETYKTVDYEKLVALLIESNKELASRVETLEAKLYGTTK